MAVLTREEVAEIQERYDDGESIEELAEEFSVSKTTIRDALATELGALDDDEDEDDLEEDEDD